MKRTRLTLEQILSMGPIRFSDEGEGGGQGGEGGTGGTGDAGGNSNDDGSGGAGDGDNSGKDDPETLKRKLANREDQARRQDAEIKRLKDAERERDELKAAREEAERKNRSELENAQADLKKAKERNSALEQQVRVFATENAFLGLADIQWHDTSDALRMVDLSSVEFDEETGKPKDPKAIKAAAEKLAKDKPYLVKSKTAAPPGTPTPRGSGRPPAGGNNAQVLTDKEKLKAKYGIRS